MGNIIETETGIVVQYVKPPPAALVSHMGGLVWAPGVPLRIQSPADDLEGQQMAKCLGPTAQVKGQMEFQASGSAWSSPRCCTNLGSEPAER